MKNIDKIKPLRRDSVLRVHLSESLNHYCNTCTSDGKSCDTLEKWLTMQDNTNPLDCELCFRDIWTVCHKCSGIGFLLCTNRQCPLFKAMRLSVSYSHGHRS